MYHSPIRLVDISLSFPQKKCFDSFNTGILHGSRIAVIGRNGSGKSTLLKIITGIHESTSGHTVLPSDIDIGYVPQIIGVHESLSGGERFNRAFSAALSLQPNLLLLDEPMNHLDVKNRQSLLRMLDSYTDTLIVVSHDVELLRRTVDSFWLIDNGSIRIFSGQYDDLIQSAIQSRADVEEAILRIHRQKKDMHRALMKEQQRAAKKRAQGLKSREQNRWSGIVADSKENSASGTAGRNMRLINSRKTELSESLASLILPEKVTPEFYFNTSDAGTRLLVSITDGSAGYGNTTTLHSINLSVFPHSRVSVSGDNGSGKSTLVRAIINDPLISKGGTWIMPDRSCAGYLDQHYANLNPEDTVLGIITKTAPGLDHKSVRRILNNFLFRKNEEVYAPVRTLSGGEKARLALAHIAVHTPRLLILDEVTNNLDLETKNHLIQTLLEYPGAMIIISHDRHFLEEMQIDTEYETKNGTVSRR